MLVSLCTILIFLMAGSKATTVTVDRFMGIGTVVEEEQTIEVTRTSQMDADASVSSIAFDLLTGMRSEVEVVKNLQELAEGCASIAQKKQTLLIPKGAGAAEYEGIRVYTWVETSENRFINAKTGKIHAALLYNHEYVAASCSGSWLDFDVTVEVGTYQ